MRTRPVRLAALAWLVAACLAAAGALAADADRGADTEALRRRVQRFYVLSYLNRHGEMWEMFTPELQRKLGDDRREYVRGARERGFELFGSEIERVEVRDGKGSVDVRLHVQLPGELGTTWRRHRMAWVASDGAWLYAGSLDVSGTNAPEPGSAVQSVPGVVAGGAIEPAQPAPTAPTAPPASTPGRRSAEAPASATPAPAAGSAERWDLVAIPPPGARAPAAEEATPVPSAPAASTAAAPPAVPAPAPATAQSVAPAPAAPAAEPPAPRVAAAAPGALPAPWEPGAPRIVPRSAARAERGAAGTAAEPTAVATERVELVRRAREGFSIRRARALERIRTSEDRALVPLLAEGVEGAPPEAQAIFLGALARMGGPEHARLAVARLDAPGPELRMAAADLLAERGGPEHVPVIAARLEADPSPEVRAMLLDALGRIGGDVSGPLLAALARPGATPRELAAAAGAAGAARALDVEPALHGILARRGPPEALARATWALGRLATPTATAALETLTTDTYRVELEGGGVPLRTLALRALADAGVPGAGARLAADMVARGMEADSSEAEAVAATGEFDAVVVLLGHVRPLVRRRAADLVGRLVAAPESARRALDALRAALASEGDDATLLALSEARARLAEAAR